MQTKDITQTVILPSQPDQIYRALLNSKIHSEIIGDRAIIEPKVDGKFSLWDDSISGRIIELNPENHKIVEEWRDNSSDWPKNHYSKVTIKIQNSSNSHSKLTLTHKGIPAKHAKSVEEGWNVFYWDSMKKYFASQE
jgi:activator of HSP90 ATPase